MSKAASRITPYALSLLRLVAGFSFCLHGCQKLFGMFGGYMDSGAAVHLLSRAGAAGILEFFGGLLVMTGLFTRPAAFLLSGEMAVAYFLIHVPRHPLPIKNGGDSAVLYCFVFLFLAAAGAGPLSLDRLRGKA
jgi:putative oxidoreductase